MAATRNLERGGKSTGMHRHQEAASQADRMMNHRTSTKPDRRDRDPRLCASHHLLSSTLAYRSPFDRQHYTKKRERGTSAAPRFIVAGIDLEFLCRCWSTPLCPRSPHSTASLHTPLRIAVRGPVQTVGCGRSLKPHRNSHTHQVSVSAKLTAADVVLPDCRGPITVTTG